MSDAFAAMIAERDEHVRDLATRTRELVLQHLPAGVVESVDGTDAGYGWTSGYTGLICVVGVQKKWVNLGFADGATLPDPTGLLQGKGKVHRFVRVASAADLAAPGLTDLLAAAVAAHPRP